MFKTMLYIIVCLVMLLVMFGVHMYANRVLVIDVCLKVVIAVYK